MIFWFINVYFSPDPFCLLDFACGYPMPPVFLLLTLLIIALCLMLLPLFFHPTFSLISILLFPAEHLAFLSLYSTNNNGWTAFDSFHGHSPLASLLLHTDFPFAFGICFHFEGEAALLVLSLISLYYYFLILIVCWW